MLSTLKRQLKFSVKTIESFNLHRNSREIWKNSGQESEIKTHGKRKKQNPARTWRCSSFSTNVYIALRIQQSSRTIRGST